MEDIWKGDKLDRESDAIYIQRYLENLYSAPKKEEGFVLNVNSRWGGGKTFFLERLAKQLQSAGYMTVLYSAWKNDYSSEPLISFVASVEEELTKKLPKAIKSEVKGLARIGLRAIKPLLPAMAAVLIRQLTGLSIEKFREVADSFGDGDSFMRDDNENDAAKKLFGDVAKKTVDTALDDYKTSKTSIDDFHKKLSRLVSALDENGKQLPIFVFIDELDRCRPTFSIELLECIKHLFSVRGMYFIVATDTEQLSHSINAIYGAEFESERYLKRFFDVEYRFKKPDYRSFSSYLASKLSLNNKYYVPSFKSKDGQDYKDVVEVLAGIFEGLSLDLRDQEQAYFLIYNICISSDYEGLHIFLLAYLAALKIKDIDLYQDQKYAALNAKISDGVRNKYTLGQIRFNTLVIENSERVGKHGNKSLLAILELYMSLSGTNDKRISEINWEAKNNMIERQVIMEAQRDLMSSALRSSPKFLDYFDVVEQAGRLSLPLTKSDS